MRKAQRQQIEEIIRQMEEAHNEIKRCIEQKNAVQAQELLSDCQNAAVAIGTLIEDTEGEGHPAVTVLEEYCELVYQTYENLVADGINANKIYKILRQKLIKAENSIRNDIKMRTEVVFLPYKASMWDSLESVWKVADADPDCDTYVIPISYFDKNPDGSFKEEHYEGEQYPDYVPVMNYDEFDFEAHHPDTIYIHNGYDDCNFVTSVHPFFYSKNLKKFTDCLVYIPYFVLAEPDPENDVAIENIKHFCTIPGVFNADRVIVQSEAMKKVYVKTLMNATNNHSDDAKKYWNSKIKGTGSPKFDKVMNTKREDLEIPKEWLKVIEKPDGSWKKIVFYNTSIGALLQHSEKMLKKIESVFETFREYKDEVALLWRPHPLIQATIESMRPQLREAYKEIRDTYIEEGCGIYDDSADLDRAVVLSDAYYGDHSSVVELCRKKGMPVLVQNIQHESFPWEALFATYQMVENGGKIWFFEALFNGLFKLDVEKGIVDWVGKIPEEEEGGKYLYQNYLSVDAKIYFAPMMAQSIAVYDTENNKFENIALDFKKGSQNANIANLYLYHQKLIFVGICQTNAMCIFLLDTGAVTYIDPESVKKIKVDLHEALYGMKGCIQDDILYIPLYKGGGALTFNLLTYEEKLLQLTDKESDSFNFAIYIPVRNVIWFVSNNGYIIQWSEREQKKQKIEISSITHEISKEFSAYQLNKTYLYLFPNSFEGKIVCLDIRTGKCINEFDNTLRIVDVKRIKGVDYYLGNTKEGEFHICHLDSRSNKVINKLHRADNKLDVTCFDEYKIRFFQRKNIVYYEGSEYDYARRFDVFLKWLLDKQDLD